MADRHHPLESNDRLFIATMASSFARQRSIVCDGIKFGDLRTSTRMQEILIQKFVDSTVGQDPERRRLFLSYLESYLRNHASLCQENVETVRRMLLESHNLTLARIIISDGDFREALEDANSGLEQEEDRLQAISVRDLERYSFARQEIERNERICRNILRRERASNNRVLQMLSSQNLEL